MLDGLHIDPRWAAAIGAALFRRGDPLGLALAAQVGLELGKNAEQVEERLAGRGRGVHGLFGGREMGTLVLECRYDDLEIVSSARRSMRVATSVPLGWMKSRMVRSSGRPVRVAPSPVSVRTMVQRAA